MKIRLARFNIYLLSGLLACGVGCETTKSPSSPGKTSSKKPNSKEYTLLRLHLQANPDGTDRTVPVAIYRKNPMTMTVSTTPFLSEANVMSAAVLEQQGVLAIQIKFDRRGTLLLENITTAYKNSWIGVLATFGESRWLAAPYIDQRITDGVFTFTPDATREEAERIVNGLTNVAKKLDNAPPAPKKTK